MASPEFAYAEFYIACNPPLLPDGVNNVIRRTHLALEQHIRQLIIEILYEPEVPWFKIISRTADQAEITRTIQRILCSIGEDEVAAVDPEEEEEYKPRNGRGRKVDVHITEERYPQMVPWISHEDSSIVRPDMFENRFPNKIETLRHRVYWRAYRFPRFESLSELLWRASLALTGTAVQWTLEDLGNHFGCSVTHNLHERAIVVYIGCGYSMQNVTRLLEALNRFAGPEATIHQDGQVTSNGFHQPSEEVNTPSAPPQTQISPVVEPALPTVPERAVRDPEPEPEPEPSPVRQSAQNVQAWLNSVQRAKEESPSGVVINIRRVSNRPSPRPSPVEIPPDTPARSSSPVPKVEETEQDLLGATSPWQETKLSGHAALAPVVKHERQDTASTDTATQAGQHSLMDSFNDVAGLSEWASLNPVAQQSTTGRNGGEPRTNAMEDLADLYGPEDDRSLTLSKKTEVEGFW